MLFRPRGSTGVDDHVVSLLAPASFEAEQYRELRHRIEELGRSRSVRVVAVTSAVAGDGKTLTAVNLAATLAQGRDSRILVVDADLRNPRVANILGVECPSGGLETALLADGGPLKKFVHSVNGSGLDVLPCAAICDKTYELLTSPRMSALLTEARARYDVVIIDTAPILPVQDSTLLRAVVDGYLLVVSANLTPRALVGEALNRLDPESIVGLVYNRDTRPLFGYYKSYYRRYFRSYARSVQRMQPDTT